MRDRIWICSLFVLSIAGARPAGAQDLGGWNAPDGGWDYVYEAFDGEDIDGEFDPSLGGSLDGKWTHQNGSDAWDGSGPGDQFRPDGTTPHAPGGAGTILIPGAADDGGDAEVLSIVDTGDPRPRGFADPSNRKLWFCHDVAQDGVDGSSSLANGFTMIVRSRNHPDIDPNTPGWQLPDGGVDNDSGNGVAPGYTLRDGGKGGHGFYDTALDRNLSCTPYGTGKYQFPPQVAEGTTPPNLLDVGDNTVFHALWITAAAGTQPDRYDITVYVDGSTTPSAVFQNAQLGDDTDCDGISHLHMGFHSTPQVGGLQVDYFGYKVGLFEPTSSCPGGFTADLDEATGRVALAWSPVATVDSYTVRRNGVAIAEGLPAAASSYTDENPLRPSAKYELVPIVGGAPKAGCKAPSATISTVVCPVLTCKADHEAGKVELTWTKPQYFEATGYTILQNGANAGNAPGDADRFTAAAAPGIYTYELVVASNPPDACPTNPFCNVQLLARGSLDVSGDNWDLVAAGGLAQKVTTSDGVKSLYFPGVPKTLGDSAFFAAQVNATGAGELPNGRFRVEVQARFDNPIRITNKSTDPVSFVQLDLSRTGVSVATDDLGNQEAVEQVPSPQEDPALPSTSSEKVNTDTIGIELVTGLNVIEIAPVDGAGNPHADPVQLFAVRIGLFPPGLDASLTQFPCASGLTCTRAGDGAITLNWSSAQAHAYDVLRDGDKIASIPLGNTTTYTDPDPGNGFFTYTLATTDTALCPELTCAAGGGAPDLDGFIREWLVFGPVDWGCTLSCANPGEDAIRTDYLAGTTGGNPVDEVSVEPVDGLEITLDAQATIRNTARADINPGRPGTGKFFTYSSFQSLIDYNLVFGEDQSNYMAYAAAYVVNQTGGDLVVDMGLTSDDAVQVLLNGQEVHVNNVARGVSPPGGGAWDVVPGITLEEGSNLVIVKVFEGGGDHGFALRFEETGVPRIDGLEISLAPPGGPPEPKFHRGDGDDNGKLELTDAIRILGFLFLGAPPPTCMDASDADDNGKLELTDAVRILGFLFLGALPPAPPGPPPDPCGADPTPLDVGTDLGCASYTKC